MIGIGKGKDSARELEKARKKRGNRKYGQAKQKPSRKGVVSCTIAGGDALLLLLCFLVAYFKKGTASVLIGFAGIGALVIAYFGFVNAIRGFRERDKDYRTCKVGVVLNGAFALGLIYIFLRGLF